MARGTYHRVRNGEDLLFLAEWYYGDSTAWTHIYYANLDVYGDDFEMIPASNVIFIPDLETTDIIGYYNGPEIPPWLPASEPPTKPPGSGWKALIPGAGKPVRLGSLLGEWRVGQKEGSDDKTIYLIFYGEGQLLPQSTRG